jgi:hypothetical protein
MATRKARATTTKTIRKLSSNLAKANITLKKERVKIKSSEINRSLNNSLLIYKFINSIIMSFKGFTKIEMNIIKVPFLQY